MRRLIKILSKFKILYLLKGYFKIRNKYYFIVKKKFYSAPSLRQAKILKGYVQKNKYYYQREQGPNFFLERIINQNSVILDIGGNLGYSALHYSRILESFGKGKCLSFEPVSSNFSDMVFNFGHLKNVMLFNFGISNEKEDLIFGMPEFSDNTNEINTGLYTSKNINKHNVVEQCKVVRLDDFLYFFYKEPCSIDYIKIDIEGAELNALQGAQKLLVTQSPIIQIEYNKSATDKEEFRNIVKYLKDLNYKPHKMTNSTFSEENGYEVFFLKNNTLEYLSEDRIFLNEFVALIND